MNPLRSVALVLSLALLACSDDAQVDPGTTPAGAGGVSGKGGTGGAATAGGASGKAGGSGTGGGGAAGTGGSSAGAGGVAAGAGGTAGRGGAGAAAGGGGGAGEAGVGGAPSTGGAAGLGGAAGAGGSAGVGGAAGGDAGASGTAGAGGEAGTAGAGGVAGSAGLAGASGSGGGRPIPRGAYFVSPAGDDDAAGTEAAPWKTLEASMEKLVPGDTLVMRGGEYDEAANPDLKPATDASPIVVMAYPGERPVLRGTLDLDNADHWRFDGLNVTWKDGTDSTEHMVTFDGGTGWVFENAEVWDAHSFAGILVTSAPEAWTLRGLYVHDTIPSNDTNQDHLIYVSDGGQAGGLIERCVLARSANGRAIKVGPPSADGAVTRNLTIRRNTMFSNLGPSNVQFSYASADNLVERNLMVRPKNQNVTAYELTGANNLVKDNLGWEADAVIEDAEGLVDGGGNVLLDPQLADPDGGDFHPLAPAAQEYGRYAP